MCVELYLFPETGNIRKPKDRDSVEDRNANVWITFYGDCKETGHKDVAWNYLIQKKDKILLKRS